MKLIKLLILFITPAITLGQAFVVNQDDSVSTCSGIIFDSGADTSYYGAGEHFEYTICPLGVGLKTEVNFQHFSLSEGDTLCIFDGSNSMGVSIGCFTGNDLLPGAIFTSNEGCLTFVFTSNSDSLYGDWDAIINCANCQKIIPAIDSDPDYAPITNYIDICPGDSVTFHAATGYPENNTNYTQNDSTSTFLYSLIGQTITTENFTHVFNSSGYYSLYMQVTDLNGCHSQKEVVAIRVSPSPIFAGTHIDVLNTLCLSDTLNLFGAYQTQYISHSYDNFGEPIYLPDGSGVTYTTDLSIGNFLLGQEVTSASDIESICINIEHSYLGDLAFSLTCPNGTTVTLSNNNVGPGVFLGAPLDDPATTPGVGWDYCFNEFSGLGTMEDYVNNNGLSGGDTLPAGTYMSYDPLSNLIGCPLNGTWTLSILDDQLADDGYIFGWGIEFASYLYGDSVGFQTEIVNSWWENPNNTNIGQDTLMYYVIQNGANPFHFYVTDDFGCVWDTTITINAAPSPITSFSSDNECTNTQPFTFNNSSSGSISSYHWDFGDGTISTAQSPTHTYATVGTYPVNLELVSTGGCKDDTTIMVTLFQAPTALFEDEIIVHCDSLELKLTNLSTETPFYRWILNGAVVSQTRDASIKLPFEAIYTLQLQVINGVCNKSTVASDTLGSFWDYYSLKIPNVFTPNNDSKNDTYSILNGLDLADCTTYQIFNRWGKLVFESSQDRPIWNGKDANGNPFEEGTYFYVITFKGKTYSGELTLLK